MDSGSGKGALDRGDGRLLAVAEAVSDRSAVDWDHEGSEDAVDAATLRHLREIAQVAAVLTGDDPSMEGAGGALFRWGTLEVLAPIGEGSYGEVYRARDPVLGREVALKLRRPGPTDVEHSNRAFVDEARRLARIDHPNVVRVLGADVHDGRVGLWTELLDGSDLAEVLARDGRLAASEAVGIAIELCRALAAVHAAGLVHGDLKPENVLRERDGRLLLTDFGAGAELTVGGRLLQVRSGTPLAMAPELLEGGAPNERTDLYSLGVLLYRLLTGRHPVEARDLGELRRKHRTEGPKPILDLRPDLSPALVEIVETALEPDPDARFASAGQMERRLRGVLAGRPARGGRVSGSPAWARVWVAVTVVGAIVLAAFAGWAWIDSLRAASEAEVEEPGVAGAIEPSGADSPSSSTGSDVLGSLPDLPVALTLRRTAAGGAETLDSGSRIRPGDQLFLEVAPDRPLHLYVLNQDLEGELFVLFPLEGVSPGNPLAAGTSYRLPGSRNGVPLDWRVTSAGGTESFLFVVAEHRLDELERELEAIAAASLRGESGSRATDGVVLRGVGGLAASSGAPSNDRLAVLSEQVERLRERGESVWVERIDLSNP